MTFSGFGGGFGAGGEGLRRDRKSGGGAGSELEQAPPREMQMLGGGVGTAFAHDGLLRWGRIAG